MVSRSIGSDEGAAHVRILEHIVGILAAVSCRARASAVCASLVVTVGADDPGMLGVKFVHSTASSGKSQWSSMR